MKNRIHAICLVAFMLAGLLDSCDKGEVPTITTLETTNITGTGATSGGILTSEGSGTIISRGVCWSTSTNPTTRGDKTADGAGAGSFSSIVTGLEGATNYFIRAYATNSAGTGYGMTMSFTTLGGDPISVTQEASVLSPTAAVLKGVINANYLSTTVSFEYGTSSSYGSTVAYTLNPVTGNVSTYISSEISGLAPQTVYHFRIKAVNSMGTIYGEDMLFVTLGQKPTVVSFLPSGISDTEVKLRGFVNPNYFSTVVTFEYGLTNNYGNNISAQENPVTGNTNTYVTAILTGLTTGTNYHFRIMAVNSLGITYTEDKLFTAQNIRVTDIDGNTYQSVVIGNQEWMNENLKTTKFNDGTEIPNVTDDFAWSVLSTAAFCWYDNSQSNKNIYGALYNWYTVQSGKLCPPGWHVPADEEWTTLENYLAYNGYNFDGSIGSNGYAKSLATDSGWSPSETTGAPGNSDYPEKRNSTGFSALPGGVRDANVSMFGSIGNFAIWWSATEDGPTTAWDRGVDYRYSSLGRGNVNKSSGFSVRCVKD
jgi:uncharacterized protein (TIGR02145 family)